MHQVDFLPACSRLFELGTELVDGGLDHVAVLPDRLLGEIVRIGIAPSTMHVVLYGREDTVRGTEHGHLHTIILNTHGKKMISADNSAVTHRPRPLIRLTSTA